jgi:uncharacterized protein YyaL (SSP411 family)
MRGSNTSRRIDLAKRWLLNSGIQNIGNDEKTNGGFNAWYDISKKDYSFIYPEITGYGITTFLFMIQTLDKDFLIKRAKMAANWLIKNCQDKCGGFKVRYIKDNEKYRFENLIYIFDTGIIVFALSNLFEITKDKIYLQSAERAANFLIKSQKENGLFYACYNLEINQFLDIADKWSTQSGSFHAKVAMGLIKLWKITRNESYRKSAKIACRAALKFQDISGRFITYRDNKGTHLHPHFYSAEGLLYTGIELKDEILIKSAVKACKWALNNQLGDGGLPSIFVDGQFIAYERADILAQALRMSTILYSFGKLEERYLKCIEKLKERLYSFQYLNKKNEKQSGGFMFGFDFDGKKLEHINSWCTMFAIQAIEMYIRYLGKKKIDLKLLI